MFMLLFKQNLALLTRNCPERSVESDSKFPFTALIDDPCPLSPGILTEATGWVMAAWGYLCFVVFVERLC